MRLVKFKLNYAGYLLAEINPGFSIPLPFCFSRYYNGCVFVNSNNMINTFNKIYNRIRNDENG